MVKRGARLLALSLLLHASAVLAQPAPPEPAKQYFEAGLEQLRAQQWSLAEAQFRSSLALVARASTEYDLAFVLFKQGKLRESAEHLQRLLDPGHYADDARYLPAAKALLAEVVAQLPIVQLEIEPPEAQLRVDGEVIAGTGSPRTLARATPARSAPAPALSASPAAPAEADSWSRVGPWIMIGVGVALLTGAGVTGIMAEHADASFTHQCPSHHDCDPQLKSLQNKVEALGLASDVLLATGAAITAGGVALRLMADTSRTDERRSVSLGAVATLRY